MKYGYKYGYSKSGALAVPAYDPTSEFAGGKQGIFLDPSDASTLFQDTGGTTQVTATGQLLKHFKDKSGRGNNITQSTDANCPTYQLDADNRPVIRFGSSDFLAGTLPLAQLGGNTSKTMLFAAKHSSLGASRAKAGYGASGGVFALINNNSDRLVAQWGADVSQAGAATTNKEIWAVVKNGNQLSLHVNGVQVIAPTTASAANIVSNVFELGRFNGSAESLMDFYGMIFVEGTADLAAPTAWLANKAGIVL